MTPSPAALDSRPGVPPRRDVASRAFGRSTTGAHCMYYESGSVQALGGVEDTAMKLNFMRRRLMALVSGVFLVIATTSAAEEPSQTPRPRPTERDELRGVDPDCDASCNTFRRECIPYCKQNGHIPNSRAASGDCKADCEGFQDQCLEACLRSNDRGVPFFPAPQRR